MSATSNKKYAQLASDIQIDKTRAALKTNGFNVTVVDNGKAAYDKALDLLPEGSEVFTLQSDTLHKTGLWGEIDGSGKYKSVRKQLDGMNRVKDGGRMRKLGSAPDFAIGSVHAITEDGHVYIASNSGSQLAADASGARNVIWVVGTQKLVKDHTDAMERLDSYTLQLESVRLHAIYGIDSFISKLLIFYRETNPDRINIILVKENLGY